MKCLRFSTFAAAVSLALLAMAGISQAAGPNPATTPASRTEAGWQQRHESMNARVKKGNVDLIFVGDSITHCWESVPDLWNKYYGKRNAVNLGISGDQTCHVLWRLDHGNIDGISPKLAVVMIGTNNAGNGQSAELVAEGVKAVVEKLRRSCRKPRSCCWPFSPAAEHNERRSSHESTPRRIRSSPSWPTTRRCSSWTSVRSSSTPTDAEQGHHARLLCIQTTKAT